MINFIYNYFLGIYNAEMITSLLHSILYSDGNTDKKKLETNTISKMIDIICRIPFTQ